jgi:hypothetical protein
MALKTIKWPTPAERFNVLKKNQVQRFSGDKPYPVPISYGKMVADLTNMQAYRKINSEIKKGKTLDDSLIDDAYEEKGKTYQNKPYEYIKRCYVAAFNLIPDRKII